MRSTHFNYTRLALAALASLTILACACLWAQDDSPIIITDGSLTIESRTPWASYSTNGNTKAHPDGNRSVTRVAITMPGNNRTVIFSGQQCTVQLRYAATDITISTGANGRGLRMTTDYNSFQQSSPNHLAHRNPNAKISQVTVVQSGNRVFDSAASGGTRIVISYQ